MPALPAWMNEHRLLIIYLFLGCCLCAHFFRVLGRYDWVLFLFLMLVAAFGFLAFMFEPVGIWDVVLFLGVWGIALYIFLGEILLEVAPWLTKTRGEQWAKELDYVYLGLGLVGILGSVNRIEQVSGRFSQVDILAPMVLVTAVVIRFLKTRAEIGGWHRPDFVPPKRRFVP